MLRQLSTIAKYSWVQLKGFSPYAIRRDAASFFPDHVQKDLVVDYPLNRNLYPTGTYLVGTPNSEVISDVCKKSGSYLGGEIEISEVLL